MVSGGAVKNQLHFLILIFARKPVFVESYILDTCHLFSLGLMANCPPLLNPENDWAHISYLDQTPRPEAPASL